MKALVRAGELRTAPEGDPAANALFESVFTERAVTHFRALTGITPRLPTVTRPVS
jgi:hypothetical protein